jgi:hypothetical protein
MIEHQLTRSGTNRMTVAELLGHVTHARLTDTSKPGTSFSTRRPSAEWKRRLPEAQLASEVVVIRDEYHGVTLLKSVVDNDDIGRVERDDEGTLYRRLSS